MTTTRCPGPIRARRACHATPSTRHERAQSHAIGTHDSHRGTHTCTGAAPHRRVRHKEPRNMRRPRETSKARPFRRMRRTAPMEAQNDGGGMAAAAAAVAAAAAACEGGERGDDPVAEVDDPPPLGMTPDAAALRLSRWVVRRPAAAQIPRPRARSVGDGPMNPGIFRKFSPRCAQKALAGSCGQRRRRAVEGEGQPVRNAISRLRQAMPIAFPSRGIARRRPDRHAQSACRVNGE